MHNIEYLVMSQIYPYCKLYQFSGINLVSDLSYFHLTNSRTVYKLLNDNFGTYCHVTCLTTSKTVSKES